MVDISVIVPVFNVEIYLHDCLTSICNQTLSDIEIICVNDGSTDNSLDILNNFAKKDNRIRIINQKNSGLGVSRNIGLSVARGKYIYFIDSDDYIDLSALEKLYDNAVSNDSDVVLFKFLKKLPNKVSKKHCEFKIDKIFGKTDYDKFVFDYHDIKKHVLNTAFSACLKLYKKEFLDSFDDLYFSTGTAFEDVLFHVKVMLNASKISFVPEYLYYYRFNQNSIVNTPDNYFDIFKVIDSVEEYLIASDHFEEFHDEFQLFKIAQISQFIMPSKSEEYFNRVRKEYQSINLKNNGIISDYYSNIYRRVLNSQNYYEYICNTYESKIRKLNSEKSSLNDEIKDLKSINNEILSSKSWRLTKPFSILKKYFYIIINKYNH